MEVTKTTLYIKGDQSVEVKNRDVTLGDLVTMECTQPNITNKLKTIKILKIPDSGKHRYVISILKIIEYIHKEYPSIRIQNLGATDLIVTYEEQKNNNRIWQACKVALITITSFIGAAFAIMTFNNDSGTPDLFTQIYELFTGKPKTGFTILELAYCIGLVVGILVFFNHFGKHKFSVDPTPIEVEMRLYENDIQTTLVSDYARKGQEIDVDKTNNAGVYRS